MTTTRATAALLVAVVFVACCVVDTTADLPIHCLHEQVMGDWVFLLSPNTFDKTIRCDNTTVEPTMKLRLALQHPSTAVDLDTGAQGFWTMIYDEGFEVVVGGRKYFAFNKYVQPAGQPSVSHCDQTLTGWYHDIEGTHWGCYVGAKSEQMAPHPSAPRPPAQLPSGSDPINALYQPDHELVAAINNHPAVLWKAQVYPDLFHGRTMKELHNMAGGTVRKHRSARVQTAVSSDMLTMLETGARVLAAPTTGSAAALAAPARLGLPESFDWRNVDGVNYDGPVRVQGFCGSCYAFAALMMLESRIRIMTRNKYQPVLSVESVLSCAHYAQGCDGGYPYLVGKFGEDFGIQLEADFPYSSGPQHGDAERCNRTLAGSLTLIRATNYHYVGGYYGACSHDAMMRDIYDNGPVAVSFDVPSDFMYYSGGVYHSTQRPEFGANPSINHWEKTSHSVTIVGWGAENDVPFWIAKNTWGEAWGEQGYFRIRRGDDESAIESMALSIIPVLPPAVLTSLRADLHH